jgi:predicted nucleic acid-binding protein
MKVLVDTSVWSLALRRGAGSASAPARELRSLIADHRVRMIGPIRQEILSGIRDEGQLAELEARLGAFPDLPLTSEDYVTAARFFNLCRAKGVRGSNTDFLISAVAARHGLAIFTTDRDFSQYARFLPIRLYPPPSVESERP